METKTSKRVKYAKNIQRYAEGVEEALLSVRNDDLFEKDEWIPHIAGILIDRVTQFETLRSDGTVKQMRQAVFDVGAASFVLSEKLFYENGETSQSAVKDVDWAIKTFEDVANGSLTTVQSINEATAIALKTLLENYVREKVGKKE